MSEKTNEKRKKELEECTFSPKIGVHKAKLQDSLLNPIKSTNISNCTTNLNTNNTVISENTNNVSTHKRANSSSCQDSYSKYVSLYYLWKNFYYRSKVYFKHKCNELHFLAKMQKLAKKEVCFAFFWNNCLG
jgi:hypothetical protein